MMGGLAAQGLSAVACLAAVLLLVLGAARLARRLPALNLSASGQPVVLRGSLTLERGRRLHLVEAAGHQTLVLTGGGADVMISLPVRP